MDHAKDDQDLAAQNGFRPSAAAGQEVAYRHVKEQSAKAQVAKELVQGG